MLLVLETHSKSQGLQPWLHIRKNFLHHVENSRCLDCTKTLWGPAPVPQAIGGIGGGGTLLLLGAPPASCSSLFKCKTIIQGDWFFYNTSLRICLWAPTLISKTFTFIFFQHFAISWCCHGVFASPLECPCKNLAKDLLLKVGPQTIWASPTGWLEMHIHGLHPRTADAESAFNRIPGDSRAQKGGAALACDAWGGIAGSSAVHIFVS